MKALDSSFSSESDKPKRNRRSNKKTEFDDKFLKDFQLYEKHLKP